MPASPPEGKVVTFYSYKGGTGRSMMLANVAWILASNGWRVLAIDWDLEAPGLHRYFEPFLPDKDLTSSDGVIDLVIDFATEAVTRAAEAADEEPETRTSPSALEDDDGTYWYRPYADIRAYAAALEWKFQDGGALHFVPAGRQGVSYATRVNSFDWEGFYVRYGGGVFLNAVRAGMKENYDYILIDSRTGVSDTSGVCTVQMPDVLVVCFTLNNQSIEGASAVARSVLEQRRPNIRILPVPMRVETGEKDKLADRRAYARELFAGFPFEPSRDVEGYWRDVEVQYWPFYAYEEVLATFADEPDVLNSILAVAERLTGYVVSGNGTPIRLVAPAQEVRESVKAQFARRGRLAASEHYDVFFSYRPDEDFVVEKIGKQLQLQGLNPAIASLLATPGKPWRQEAREALQTADSCAIFVGAHGLDDLQRSDLATAIERAQRDEAFRVFAVLLPGLPDTFDVSDLPPELAQRQWVDLRGSVDDPASLDMLARAVRPMRQEAPPSEAVAPYPGPLPFQGSQAQFFCGRDTEIALMLEALSERPFVTLVGASGSGKTSLVRAGVIPALRAGRLPGSDKWIIERIRPGASPLEALRRSLVRHGAAPELEQFANEETTFQAGSEQALKGHPEAERFLLVVDQAEELFAASLDSATSRAFIRNVCAASAPTSRTSVIFVLRLDGYPAIADYPELAALVAEKTILLPALEEERLRDAIVQPATRAGLTLETGLVERIMQDVQSEPGALPLLQLALLGIWERRSGTMLTLAGYQEVGGVTRSAVTRAESVVSAFDPAEEKIAKRVFLRLAEPGDEGPDTRRRATQEELLGSGPDPDAAKAVVETLINANLLVTSSDRATGKVFVDVAHEALIRTWPRLVRWIEEDRQALRIQRKLTTAMKEWLAVDGDDKFLLRGPLLDEAIELRKSEGGQLSEGELAFVVASQKHLRRERTRRWVFAALAYPAFVALYLALSRFF